MAQTTTKPGPAAKSPTTRTRATTRKPPMTTPRAAPAVDRTKELSEEVIDSLEKAQRTAIEAVRNFVDTVDHTLPALPHGEGPSRRQEIIDSALDMADRLVHTQIRLHPQGDRQRRQIAEQLGRREVGPSTLAPATFDCGTMRPSAWTATSSPELACTTRHAEARELIGSDVAADGATATHFVFAQESDGRLRAGGSEPGMTATGRAPITGTGGAGVSVELDRPPAAEGE